MTDQREDFEEAAARMGLSLFLRNASSEDGEYLMDATQRAWDMWQECCALKAEPVGYLHCRPERIPCFFETLDGAMLSGCEVVPVYTHPPSAVVPEWVKQSERTTDHRCIAYTPNEDISIMFRIVPEKMLRHCFDVTYWMPLPAPPKQEQES